MRVQKVNANNMNPMEMNNASSMMGMYNVIQKIGKGKRKYSITLDKADKKFLGKFLEEAKKQFSSGGEQGKPIVDFFNYIEEICKNKDKNELRLSFEEMEFMKRMLSDSIKGMEGMSFKWWQFIKKSMLKMMLKQYRDLLKKIN